MPLADAGPVETTTAGSRQGAGHDSATGARILLIEDDAVVRTGTQQQLESWGYHCVAVEDLEAAHGVVRRLPPDLIISDYRLRRHRTGAEVISALRQQLGRPIPAILITGDTAPERILEARASGIPLLHKPVAPAELKCKITEMLETGWPSFPKPEH